MNEIADERDRMSQYDLEVPHDAVGQGHRTVMWAIHAAVLANLERRLRREIRDASSS